MELGAWSKQNYLSLFMSGLCDRKEEERQIMTKAIGSHQLKSFEKMGRVESDVGKNSNVSQIWKKKYKK